MSKYNKIDEFRELAAFSVLFYLIPIVLLSLGYIPFEARHVILLIMGLVLVAYSIAKGVKPRKLGFRKDNLRSSLFWNFIISIGAVSLMYFLYRLNILTAVNYEGSIAFLIFYIFISVPIQEYIFRSLMIYEIGIFTKNRYALVGISTVMYSLSHAMYHSWQVIGVTLIMGIIWGFMYLKRPNFWGIALSHAIIGAAAVFIGIV